MNTLIRSIPTRPVLRTVSQERQASAPTRHMYRARDFGIGYGNSSGYASDKRYTPSWGQPRFKFG
jgi:hypothetical protein